jgi:ABC-type Na+ efflux pump permease subunit
MDGGFRLLVFFIIGVTVIAGIEVGLEDFFNLSEDVAQIVTGVIVVIGIGAFFVIKSKE